MHPSLVATTVTTAATASQQQQQQQRLSRSSDETASSVSFSSSHIDMSGSVMTTPTTTDAVGHTNKTNRHRSLLFHRKRNVNVPNVSTAQNRVSGSSSGSAGVANDTAATGRTKDERDQNATTHHSSSFISSSSFLGFRQRLERWHILGDHSNHHDDDDDTSHCIKDDRRRRRRNRNPCTDFTSAAPNHTTGTSTSTIMSGGSSSSVFSLGRFSSLCSLNPPPPSHQDESRFPTVLEEEEDPEHDDHDDDDDVAAAITPITAANTTTTNTLKDVSTSSSSSPCPTNRFFATKKTEDTVIRVNGIQIGLDSSGQTGLYWGMLDVQTKRPHGRGKMMYFAQDTDTKEEQEEPSDPPTETVTKEKEEEAQSERTEEESCLGPVLVYDGQWQNGDWCGFGTLLDLIHGHTYEGGFFDNYKHGLGVLQYADGRVYDGIFAFGKLEGKGHLEYPDGTKYWGHWTSDGIEHGRGKKVFPDGRVYDGEFDNGVLHGHGRMTYADGSWYLGEWIDGEPNGLGIMVLPDGNLKFEGTFIRGSPIEGSSFPNHSKKSDGDFLCYRSSLAKNGTLVGNIPKFVYMPEDRLKWAK
ncbi:2-isopropylmalate synthase [Nitzschia inconspicua]|uniref:2-isopropylmalate synthase n=1 Tax=Nitzschia inconspicua TaxID=303405 RepID=A0A9K3KF99_9STRA|nr:2-isopropylmalate synthase [Nitzschia inconspicua]